MNRGRCLALLAALVAVISCLPADAWAIPVFARKYGVNCTMCHTAYPRLNDFGARFRDQGYRMIGREDAEKTVLESPPPVAARTSAGYDYIEMRNVPSPSLKRGLEVSGLDILAAGLLGQRIGFFMVFVPGITEARGLAGQEATLESANLVFSEIGGSELSLRAGRFEPAYTAFSVKRHLGVAAYDVYDYSFPGGLQYSATQTGLEFRYGGSGRLRGAAGLVEGSGTNRASDNPQDAYLRLEGVVGAGEGQTAGQRIGLVGYMGRARPDVSVAAPTDELQSFNRVGVDASLNTRGVNLGLQYLWAHDDGALWGQADATTWDGGFAELSVVPGMNTVVLARVDMVGEPSFLDRDVWRYTAGGRYYFEDNVAAHLEYSHQVITSTAPDDPTEDFFTLRVDLAF